VKGYWTCQRVKAGVKCGRENPNRKRNCLTCGKPRRPRKPPAHMSALKLSYAYYALLNGGEHCGICGTSQLRLYRDHEHKGAGTPRGLLCWPCNSRLPERVDLAWLRAAVLYLERVEERRAE
jgi:hypothetical protein